MAVDTTLETHAFFYPFIAKHFPHSTRPSDPPLLFKSVTLAAWARIGGSFGLVIYFTFLRRCDATSDEFIDVVEGNRTYVPCIYLLNKIDQISIQELGKAKCLCACVWERDSVCVWEREREKWKKREWERVRRGGRGETEREGESGWERDRRQTNRRAYQEPAIQLRAYLFFDFSSLFVARYHLQNPAHGSHLGPPQVELRLPAWEDVGLPQASEDLHQAEGTGKRLGLSGCGPFLGTMILMLLLWNALSVRQS